MTPTEKDSLLLHLDKKFIEQDYLGALSVWEASKHNSQLTDAPDYSILTYVMEAHYELKQFKEANTYLALLMHSTFNHNFQNALSEDRNNNVEYLWSLKFIISKELEGTYGMVKTTLEKQKAGFKLNNNSQSLLNLTRNAFRKKIVDKFIWVFMSLIILKIILNNAGYIPNNNWLTLISLVISILIIVYAMYPKIYLPLLDKLMLVWLKYFKKNKRPQN